MMRRKKQPRLDESLTTRDVVQVFDIKNRASADAQRGEPKADATQEPATILEVRETFDLRIAGRHRDWAERSQLLRDAVEDVSETEVGDISLVADEIEAEVLQTFADLSNEARLRIGEETSFKRTLAAFRSRRKVYRAPMGKRAKLGYFAPVGVSTLVDGCAYSWTFGETTSFGILGAIGVAVAVSVSGATVAIFGAAIPARALNEPTWWGRTLGVIGVGLAGALLLAINWGAAKFRDIAAAGGDIESALQVAKLLSAEWNLTVPGLAAFCFGMANGIYVWVRTSKAFDPVMGLERHVQMHQDKLDAVHELEANIDGRLSQILDRTVAYGRDKPVIISAELKRLRAEATALLIKRQRNEDLETSDLKALVGSIDLYRKTNTFVRGDKVIPVCLQGDVDVSGLTRDYGSLDDIVATIESKTVTQKQAADTWVKQVNGLADIVGEIKEQAPHILQAIAQHDVEQGPVPELKAIREKFRKLGEAEGSDAETTGGGWVDTDGGEPWGIEQRVGA